MVNREEIRPEHFVVPEGKGGLRITPDGLKTFLVAYEKALAQIPESQAKADGVAWGKRVAEAILAVRRAGSSYTGGSRSGRAPRRARSRRASHRGSVGTTTTP